MNMKKIEKALRQSRTLGAQREPKQTIKQCPYKRKHTL